MFFWARVLEYLRFAWDALMANKIRAFLTTLGILIGVAAIIFIFTLIQGINKYVEGEFANLGSTTVYVSKFPWVITGNYFELRNRPPITIREYRALERYATYPRWMTPVFESMRTIEYRSKTLESVYVVGCNEQYTETHNTETELGRWFTASEVRSARPVCIIGQSVKEELFGKENPLGKRIKINGFPYKVIGVLEKKGSFFGFNMDNQTIIPYTTFRGYTFNRRSITIALKVENPDDLEPMKDEVRGILRRVRKLSPRESDNFAINQQDMLTDFYRKLTGTSFLVVIIIATISLVVGGIGIMNIMLVSVTERTREIGIRKAVGATRKQIMFHFITESLAISLVGGFLGVVIGILAAQVPLKYMHLESGVSVGTVLIGFFFAAAVGFISGLYPAYKAARLNPIDALRYE
ncbi:MAG: FtsX-like permease family protein [Calditrichaeota bacterium]|nr:FtsX-like permease family protein [Calditrichota bacterium]